MPNPTASQLRIPSTSSQQDIIIIGGGTAGCVLASRLSSALSSDRHILLLEAGPNNNADAKVRTPASSRRMFGDPHYDWCLQSVPQDELDGRVLAQTRGRMLGGSSAINSHSLVYPNREMHEAWARLVGDQRWGWEGMRECYARFQEVLPQEEAGLPGDINSIETKDRPQRRGPVKASFPTQLNRLQRAWMHAWDEVGAVAPADPLTRDAVVGGTTTTNAIDSRPGKGERSHAGNAFLEARMAQSSNLTVKTGVLVERILFERRIREAGGETEELRAVGVVYRNLNDSSSELFLAGASQEIILCAGVFGSPQLLELSGLGQHAVLEAAGVEQLLDLPGVGEFTRSPYGPSVEVRSNIETLDGRRHDKSLQAEHQCLYDATKTGALAEGAAYCFAYWSLQLFNDEGDEAAIRDAIEAHRASSHGQSKDDAGTLDRNQYIYDTLLSPTGASATVFMTRIARYPDSFHTTSNMEADGKYMSVIAMLSHPLSRGSTHIRIDSARQAPIIDPRYLSDDLDAEILARHVLQLEKFLALPAFADVVIPPAATATDDDHLANGGGRRQPRAFSQPLETVAQAKEAIKRFGATNYHPCGTCAMMPRAKNGVVDGTLKVHGTQNLRVCDASVFPIIPRGSILTTVYAVAEKAVDIVLEEWGMISI